jgi:hypothetical protein
MLVISPARCGTLLSKHFFGAGLETHPYGVCSTFASELSTKERVMARVVLAFLGLLAIFGGPVFADEAVGTPLVSNAGKAEVLPVPTDAEQKKARAGIEPIFKDDLAAAKSAAQRSELAKKLLQVAIDPGSSPAECYVLLITARDLAADAADVPTGIQIVTQLATRYRVHADEMVAASLPRLIKSFPRDRDPSPVVEPILGLIDKSIREDRYDVARTLAAEVASLAGRVNDPALKAQVAGCVADVRRCEAAYNEAQTARKTLEKNPNDPAANLALGRYLCFSKGDWEKGLPRLANGSDAKLKALALAERTPPEDAARQKDLGDDWYDYAQGQSSTIKTHALAHGGDWYRKAGPKLIGLAKVAVDKRLEQIEKITSAPVAASTGTPKPADWTDLLKNVDPARNAAQGTWVRTATGVTNNGSNAREVLVLPGGIDTAYELEFSFVRTAGDNTAMFAFPAGAGKGQLFLSAWNGETSMISIAGQNPRANDSSVHPGPLENNHAYMLHVRVVPEGDDVSINVDLDGRHYTGYRGAQKRLIHLGGWELPAGSVFGFGGQPNSRIVVSAARMRPIKVAAVDATGWIDLLKMIDPQRDTVGGTWVREGDKISSAATTGSDRISIPVMPQGNYDMQVTFTRETGVNNVAIIFPAGISHAALVLGGWNGNETSGLHAIDGKAPNANPTGVPHSPLVNGTPYTADLHVRLQGADVDVTVELNGKPFLKWHGAQSAFTGAQAWTLPNSAMPGLGAANARTTFSSARIHMVSGKLVPLVTSGAAVAPAPLPDAVDILRTIDVSKHAIIGEWTRGVGGVATSADPPSGHVLMLPAATDGQYDLQATFTRTAGEADVGIIFPVGTARTELVFCAGHAFTGLELVRGARINMGDAAANPTIVRDLRLVNNRPYTVDLKVRLKDRDAEITVLLDGQSIIHWAGPQSALSCRGDQHLPDPHGFGIGTYQSAALFSNIKIKAVSGQLVAAKEPAK